MIKKIVCASYGIENSVDVINYLLSVAEKFNSEIILLYVKPRSYFEGIKYIPGDSSRLYSNWIEGITEKEINKLKEISDSAQEKKIKWRIELREGIIDEEILSFASEEKADLISFSKVKRTGTDSPIPRPSLKLIRQSDIPVLTVNRLDKELDIKTVLVPTGLYDLNSNDIKYAVELSEHLNSKIYQLNVLETEQYSFPEDLVSKYMDEAYKVISHMNLGFENIEQRVIESVNAYTGISEFIKENNIDLIVMNTYRGEQGEKKEFIGSIAERVLQTADCPIITIRPY